MQYINFFPCKNCQFKGGFTVRLTRQHLAAVHHLHYMYNSFWALHEATRMCIRDATLCVMQDKVWPCVKYQVYSESHIFLSVFITASVMRWWPFVHTHLSVKPTHWTLRLFPFHSDLVGHCIDIGPSIIDGELAGVISFPDEVQVALIVLVSFTRHTNQRLTAADNHCPVLPVDPW